MEITKASESQVGCWVDGHWGQYLVPRVVEIAMEFGYNDIDDANKAFIVRWVNAGLRRDDDEFVDTWLDEVDNVIEWMNENVAPEGYAFGLADGEFFFMPVEWWEDD